MEELRSTEILDKEIQEDARRKANRILNNGVLECEKILTDVNNRFERDANLIRSEYEKKINDYKINKEASIPLEQQRFLVDFENNSIDLAINQFLEKLSDNENLEIIKKMIEKYAFAFDEKKVNVEFHGFSKEEITKVVNSVLSTEKILSVKEVEDKMSKDFRGCIITSEDLKTMCRATLEEKIAEIKEQYTEDLALALFGGRLPE